VTAAAVAARDFLDNPAEYKEAIRLSIHVARAFPKGWSKKKKAAMEWHPCLTKPDSNNVAAAIMDALNHVLYVDDKQVYSLSIRQSWAERHITVINVWYEPEEVLP
jgi:Holliday junction resolvase RusA-like endonuclease